MRCPETSPAIIRPFLWCQPDTKENHTKDKLMWDYILEVWRKQPETVEKDDADELRLVFRRWLGFILAR